MTYLWPALFAVFAWWFSTGAIIFLDGLPQKTFKWSMTGASGLAALSLWGLWASAEDPSVMGAYLAFASALGLWAWHEISFYLGYVTGPRKHACAHGCAGWRHFGHALGVTLWHELAILAAFAVLLAVTWDAPNRIGLWSFAILWGMHESARLNVFLGVRNLNAQFLPPHLAYLSSFLRQKPMNAFFPAAVTAATVLFGVLAVAAGLAEEPERQAGLTFLAALAALGVIEHWFLVLPIPAENLWTWGMRSREPAVRTGAERKPAARRGETARFHGAGSRAEPAMRLVHQERLASAHSAGAK
jgi:putative photosynthetic complex assembly protein 2